MLTIQYKIRQATKFVSVARSPEVFALLQKIGFTREELEQGRAFVARTSQVGKIGAPGGLLDHELIGRTEAYIGFWFPLVRAVLTRGYPEFVDLFFDKLTQLSGRDSLHSLARFVDKLGKLGAGAAPFGAKGTEARALLTTRKLTAEVEAEGNALLKEWGQLREVEFVADPHEYRDAVEEAWRWYCEWRNLARVVIKSGRILRGLGLGRRTAPSGEEVDIDEGESEESDEGQSKTAAPLALNSTPVPELAPSPPRATEMPESQKGAAE